MASRYSRGRTHAKSFRYGFLHSFPESFTLSVVRSPPRLNLIAGNISHTVLAVVDAHDGFPVLGLRLLRSGRGNPTNASPSSLSSPFSGCHNTGYDDDFSTAAAEWSVVSGEGEGTVAQWSILGLAGEADKKSVEEQGPRYPEAVSFYKIGEYKV